MSVYSGYLSALKARKQANKAYFGESSSELDSHRPREMQLKTSIQKKFFIVCLSLIVLLAASISTAYFLLIKHDKRQESQRRIQIGCNMLVHDLMIQIDTFKQGMKEFLQDSTAIRGAAAMYAGQMDTQGTSQITQSIARSYLLGVTDDLKRFAHIIAVDRLVLYGADASIMALYQRDHEGGESIGLSTISEAGNQTYLALDDPAVSTQMLSGNIPIPDQLFPFGVATHYYGDIPSRVTATLFTEGLHLGLRITAPVYHLDAIVGVLAGDVLYTQEWIQQMASLSQTEVNLFIGSQRSIGSLEAQQDLMAEVNEGMPTVTMEEFLAFADGELRIRTVPVAFDKKKFYQGAYAILDQEGGVNTFTVSVSKAIEDRAIQRVLSAVLTISGLAMIVVFSLSVVLSRRSMRALHYLVSVIGAAASGNLKHTAPVMSHDEFGVLAVKLNEMIVRLRDVSNQTQAVSQVVTVTADKILSEVDALFGLMENQSSAVDNTTEAVERIDQFIHLVVANIKELLEVTNQVSAAIQTMSVTTEGVAASTGHLNSNLQGISSFIDQVSSTSRQILLNADQLLETVRETETEILQIGQFLLNVSRNAEQSRQLAEDTVGAALQGQKAVKTSIEGMNDLKDVVSQSAQIMNNVKTRSQHVSSILDIVDDITEKTSLLSINASIISAQAGEHGRGFAVVANEIRDLSSQTKASTQEISALIASLQHEVAQGVKSVKEGIRKTEQGADLAYAVKESLALIIDRARQSSGHASDTVDLIQQTLARNESTQVSMTTVSKMTSDIRSEIQKEERNLGQVVESIENIRAMSEQVTQANVDQHEAAEQIEDRMELVTEKLMSLSQQTHQLQQSSDQIVDAMRNIDTITENILKNTTTMSEHTVTRLVHQSGALQHGLSVFQIE